MPELQGPAPVFSFLLHSSTFLRLYLGGVKTNATHIRSDKQREKVKTKDPLSSVTDSQHRERTN